MTRVNAAVNHDQEEYENDDDEFNPDNPVEYWGITISPSFGGGYDNLALAFRDILCENGWKEDHIKALAGDDGTYQNAVDALNWLADNSDANDKVLFHHMGHGWADALCLKGENIYYSELDQFLDDVECDGIAIILNGCESGGAIPYLEQEGRVILTATNANTSSGGTFFSQFCSIGLQGFADFEGNNNNWTTAEEIYEFLKDDNSDPGQISDSYNGELDISHFNYINNPGLLDQYNVHDGGDGNPPLYATWWAAQSFKSEFPVLSGVMLYIGNKKGDPGPITVSIKEDLLEDDLSSVTVEQDEFYSNAFKFHTFDLPDITITPGQEYWIVLKTYGQKWDNMYYTMDAGNYYTEGGLAVSYDQGKSWTMHYYTWKDMYFATFGRPIDDPPLKPNTPLGPVTGFSNVLHTYSTSTIDPESNQIYYKWDWGDGNFSDWLGPFDSGENAEAMHSWRFAGTYTIRVKAKDPYCAESEWSDGLDISIINDPPNPPRVSGPLSGKVGEEYDYIFVSIDPDGDGIASYMISWGDDNTEVVEGPFASDEEITVSHIWDEQGNYTIKAKAIDIYGAESEWGELQVTMPRDKVVNRPFLNFLQSHPNLFPILQKLLLLRLGL